MKLQKNFKYTETQAKAIYMQKKAEQLLLMYLNVM